MVFSSPRRYKTNKEKEEKETFPKVAAIRKKEDDENKEYKYFLYHNYL